MAGATKKRPVLGRGFNSLISDDIDKSLLLNSDEQIQQIPVDQLQPNPNQPRQEFHPEQLAELTASIKQHGIIQPLVVTPAKGGKYSLIAGERRWRAASKGGLKTVPAVIRTAKELEQLEIAIIENVQRVDLSPLEQAVSMERLHEQFSVSYQDIAKRLGKATSTIFNIVRLLNLPQAAKDALTSHKITEGHARTILALTGDDERQDYLLKSIVHQKWSVRQAERYVTSVKSGFKEKKEARARVSMETPQTRRLSKKLGTQVNVRRMARGGRLEIAFGSDADLDRLLHLFD